MEHSAKGEVPSFLCRSRYLGRLQFRGNRREKVEWGRGKGEGKAAGRGAKTDKFPPASEVTVSYVGECQSVVVRG